MLATEKIICADLMTELMRRVARIEAGSCIPECLKELGLLALHLSVMNSELKFRDLLWEIIGEVEPSLAESQASSFLFAANQ